jgi:hypothetical protein
MIGLMDQNTLKSRLDYDPATGIFRWRNNYPPRAKAGEVAGYNNGTGYIKISIAGKRYYAHRLAFIWVLGTEPKIVDHLNGVKYDNRWCNLRSVTQTINGGNRLPCKGVRKRYGKWYARHANTHLGVFDTREEAVFAYTQAHQIAAGIDVCATRSELNLENVIGKRWSHNVITYQDKTLNQWAKILGIPQPSLHYKVTVQGISLQSIVDSRV